MAGLDINAREVLLLSEAYSEVRSCLHIARLARDKRIPVSIFVFGNPDLYRFFGQVNKVVFNNELNIHYYELFRQGVLAGGIFNRLVYYLKDTFLRRAYYWRIHRDHFANVSGGAVYFFTRYMSPYNYYFLSRLSRKNEITYVCTLDYPGQVKRYIPHNPCDLLSLLKLKATYGCGITYAQFPHARFEYLPDWFILKKVDRAFSLEETDELLRDFSFEEFRIFDSSAYHVIYFDQPLIESGRIADDAVFRRELDDIFTVLGKYFPGRKIALKYHPVSHTNKSFIKTGEILDDSLPAEMLYRPNIKLYLSFSSGALANVEEGLAVSLLNLVTFKDEAARQFIKETLIQRSRSAILFPQTLAELESIIASAAGTNNE